GTRILGTQENPKLYDLVLFWYYPRNLKELLTEFEIENGEFESWIDIIPDSYRWWFVATDRQLKLKDKSWVKQFIQADYVIMDWFTEQKRQVDYELSE
ncbi:6080_t:CDS:2, partial [Racocetra persica]